MSDHLPIDIKPQYAKQSYLDSERYHSLYQQSLDNPDGFWGEQAQHFISWISPWKKIQSGDFSRGEIRWFEGGKLNASVNCIDRHLPQKAQQTAIIFEGDDPTESYHVSYQELYDRVCRFANVLKQRGVKKGDRVCIYLPMIPEAAYAMLACARIGAIHSVVFGGFSAEALKGRILDADCSVLITANASVRGGKIIHLKQQADVALEHCPAVHTCLVVRVTEARTPLRADRDLWIADAMAQVNAVCEPEIMDAEDPLFILYTSGSTGQPKGVCHTTGGYLLYTAMTFHYVFDYHPQEIFWCTADVGWVTGHSYIVYGPLASGATTLMFAGVPNYPSYSRFWEIIDKHQVNIFYTAPTAIRALMREGDALVKSCSRKSLRLLGTVGEPINPEVWEWYYRIVGDERCPIVDTWWQTETGGILLSPLPGAMRLKPGSVAKPFFGAEPALLDDHGDLVHGEGSGTLVMRRAWPGMMRTVYGDHNRFVNTYFKPHPGYYLTGDGARRDADGYYWITGREDDVINVSGHRLGTAEIESAILEHDSIAEAAVVGIPHDIKGQAIYAFVTPKIDVCMSSELLASVKQTVREVISPIAVPDTIQWTPALPKTRSGKIMRRILRKIASGEHEALGDISTLADPNVVEEILKEFRKLPFSRLAGEGGEGG